MKLGPSNPKTVKIGYNGQGLQGLTRRPENNWPLWAPGPSSGGYHSQKGIVPLKSILLIYPPFTAPSAPPLGIASLASSLREGGAEVHLLDLNVEAYDRLLSPDFPTPQDRDTFSERSLRTLTMGVSNLRGCGPSAGFKRYKEIISHLQRALWLRSEGAGGPKVTLGDFSHPSLSPLKTGDLKLMASMRDLGHLKSWMETRLETTINEARPDYMGISVQFLSQALPGMAIAGMVRELLPHTKITTGGGLVSL